MSLPDASGTHLWVLREEEHWLRCDHAGTALDADRTVVLLARTPRPRPAAVGDPAARRYGVAFDARGRLFRASPAAGLVERLHDGAAVRIGQGVGGPPLELGEPRGLAIDGLGRLYIADAGAARVVILDLASGRAIARIRPPPVGGRASRPWDLAADPEGAGAYLLDRGTASLWRILPDRPPIQLLGAGGVWEHAGAASLSDPVAIVVVGGGVVAVLDRDAAYGPAGAAVIWARRHDVRAAPLPAGTADPRVTDAATLALDADGRVVVGGDPRATLVRYRPSGTAPDDLRFELHAEAELHAWGFDGGALARDGAGRLVHSTAAGARPPAPAAPDYGREGDVITFALDSGIAGCVWHRIFLEAYLPAPTELHVRTRTAESLDDAGPALRAPQGFDDTDMRPWAGSPAASVDAPDWMPLPRLLRRPAGADRPFYTPSDKSPLLDLYEGLVFSPPGRYLWVHLRLAGTDRVTPVVGGLRVYYPRNSYLRYLPEIWREDPRAADFLDRLLSIFETFHGEIDAIRDNLATLFRPDSVPSEALDWLAGWVGLVLDPRWPEAKRRQLLARAARLYQQRGTMAGLSGFLAVYLDHPFHIVEGFRTRRSGATVLGVEPEKGATVLGPGYLLHDPTALLGDTESHAHRFTVFVGGAMTADELSVVQRILELEKPAHTQADICDVTETMAVGQRALVGINTLLGRVECLRPAVVDDWSLGRGVVLGGEPPARRSMGVGTINVGRNSVLR
jgi:phage tail-like protein